MIIWTQELLTQIKEMTERGMTSQGIVSALKIDGLTRNAILGKLWREKNKDKPKPPPRKRSIIQPIGTYTLGQLKDDQCHYPMKSGYCGVICNKSKLQFCEKHTQQARRK